MKTGSLGRGSLLLLVTCCVGLVSLSAFSASAPRVSSAQDNKYIGAPKCKNCHDSDEKGNQYAVWENMPHAKAFERLGSEEAKKLGAERGIADPQTAPECLKCHVTAYGVDEELVKKGFDPKLGVQCESCHGPGELHMKARFKAAATKQPDQKVEPGEIIVDVTQATCLGCHNEESPSFKGFCFYERYEKIRHPRPDSTHEMLVCGCGECACTTGCPDDGCGVPAAK